MKGKKIMMNKKGFTLAEVLITLGIIGVVAAMTIPTLMNQTGQAEFKTGFKKVISTLSQAVTMSVALNSTDFSTLASTPTTDEGSVYGMLNGRMNVIKTAYNDATILGGTPTIGAANYTLFFNDGMVISFPTVCGQTALTGAAATSVCKAVIDTNGVKKPNKLTNCESSGTATTEGTTACTAANNVIGDRFSIRFFNQQVIPNGPAARYVMYN
jgi:prepilin-type N-terminal cleavage/methylation domain-containing protein